MFVVSGPSLKDMFPGVFDVALNMGDLTVCVGVLGVVVVTVDPQMVSDGDVESMSML